MRNYYNPTTFHDLLMNSLLGFVMLFTVAILLINPSDKRANIETKAEYVISVTWPEEYKSDIDTWLEDPLGNLLYFQDKEKGLMHLDRDDLGEDNDAVIINGQKIIYPYNQELTTIRGFLPGEWVLNIHLYNKKDKDSDVIPVTVRIDKLNPTLHTVLVKKFLMKKNWQEETVARFTMTTDGTILSWDDLYKKLVIVEDNSGFSAGGGM